VFRKKNSREKKNSANTEAKLLLMLTGLLGRLHHRWSYLDVRAIIPYQANQNKKEAHVSRVDKYFRTFGLVEEKKIYKQRNAVERVNSGKKEQLCLERHRARRCELVTVHALLCMIVMLFNAYAAVRLSRPEKAINRHARKIKRN
jgi:hypothetical protein